MTYVITHTKDLDGVASAAIVAREYVGARVVLADYNDDYLNAVEREVRPRQGELIVIADIGCNKGTIARWASMASGWRSAGAKVLWLDHHAWDQECLKAIEGAVDELTHDTEGRCAAEVVFERLGRPGDYVESRLAEMAHDADFNIRQDPLAVLLSRLISYYDYLGGRGDCMKLQLVELLASGVFWTAGMDAHLREYDEILRRDYELLLKSRVREIDGLRVVVGLRGAYSGTEAANIVREKLGGDVIFMVSGRGHLSIRSERDDINTKALGEAFGGGGHLRHAAGGSIEDAFPNPTEDQLDAIADYIVSRISGLKFRLEPEQGIGQQGRARHPADDREPGFGWPAACEGRSAACFTLPKEGKADGLTIPILNRGAPRAWSRQ